jgi:hypothetical protein
MAVKRAIVGSCPKVWPCFVDTGRKTLPVTRRAFIINHVASVICDTDSFTLKSFLICILIVLQSPWRDDIAKHRTSHATAIIDARKGLEAAILAEIKVAAKEENLDELRALLMAHDRLVSRSELPRHPGLKSATEDYVRQRKESARRVYEAYRAAIEAAAKELALEEATAIRGEMESFVNGERIAFGLQPVESKKNALAKDASAEPAIAVADTGAFLKEFIGRFEQELQLLRNADTTLQQVERHGEIVGKFDAELQKRELTFTFPIENVTPLPDRYLLSLGKADQLKDIDIAARLSSVHEQLRRGDALSIRKGQNYRITGHGRLVYEVAKLNSRESKKSWKIFSFECAGGELTAALTGTYGLAYGYSIYLHEFKTSID